MSEELNAQDHLLRAALDDFERCAEEVERAKEEVARWQQENPPPLMPQTVDSLTEMEDYESENKKYGFRLGVWTDKLKKAQIKKREAENKAEKLLPSEYFYRYRGKRYQSRNGGVYSPESAPDYSENFPAGSDVGE